LRLILDWPM